MTESEKEKEGNKQTNKHKTIFCAYEHEGSMLDRVSFCQNYEEASAAVILSLLPHPHSPPVDSLFSGFCLGGVPGRLGCFWCLLTCTHPLPTATSFCNSVQRVRLAGTLLTPVLSGLQRQDPSP